MTNDLWNFINQLRLTNPLDAMQEYKTLPVTSRCALPISAESPAPGATWHWNTASSPNVELAISKWNSSRLSSPIMRYRGYPGIVRLNPVSSHRQRSDVIRALLFRDPDISPGHIPRTCYPGHFPLPDNSFFLFTYCWTFPPFHHHHPPNTI